MPSNPGWITSAVNHRKYDDVVVVLGVIDSKWKGLAKQAMVICVHDSVGPCINPQALDICFQRTYEIVSQADFLGLVKAEPLIQISER
jgi:2-C-methyl-D-erythritol 4-phosphate cytidylyltransferase